MDPASAGLDHPSTSRRAQHQAEISSSRCVIADDEPLALSLASSLLASWRGAGAPVPRGASDSDRGGEGTSF